MRSVINVFSNAFKIKLWIILKILVIGIEGKNILTRPRCSFKRLSDDKLSDIIFKIDNTLI